MSKASRGAYSLPLPGFALGEDQAIPDLFSDAPRAPEHVVEVTGVDGPADDVHPRQPGWRPTRASSATPQEQGWPTWSDATLDNLSTPVAKFEANVAAIQLLQALESAQRTPSPDERRTLMRFTGWGGIPASFNHDGRDANWRARAQRLQTLVSDDEYAAALASVNTSHYTDPLVIHWMWEALVRMGFKGGRVLEPSAGVGHFLGCMPPDLACKSQVTAIEVDCIAARILSKLYADSGVDVRNQATEAAQLASGAYDLVISNIPFGNFGISDGRNLPYSRFSIHNWFAARGLDALRAGGMLCVITSSYLLDEPDTAARSYLASHAELIAAFRLPSGTFAGLGGTDVQADVVVLRKRQGPAADDAASAGWLNLGFVPAELRRCNDPYMRINEWFLSHPGHLFGRVDKVSNGYTPVPTVMPDGDLSDALRRASTLFPTGAYVQSIPTVLPKPRAQAPAGARPGSFQVEQGRIMLSVPDGLVDVTDTLSATARQRIAGLAEIRDLTRSLLRAQTDERSDASLAPGRIRLNAAYDRFVRKYGCLSNRANAMAFRRDPDYPLLLSLEHYDDEEDVATKAAIFTRRTVCPVREPQTAGTPEEALAQCLHWRGRVDPDYMGKLLQADPSAVADALLEAALIFRDPSTGDTFLSADAYLSGNVKQKLLVAVGAGAAYMNNVRALEKVIPEDLPPASIQPCLGAVWIPSDVVERFLIEALKVDEATVRYLALAGTWSVKVNDWQVRNNVACTQEFGTARMDAVQLLQLALNVQTPTVRDPHPEKEGAYIVNKPETLAAREKLGALKERFATWCFEEARRRERLCRIYNDQFNCLRPRTFDGKHLVLPGFSNCYSLHDSQRNAIWRIVQSGNTLLAHAVGAGKTAIMVAASMELRRLGLANKPCHVVPNHMLLQYTAEFMRMYPGAAVLMATKEDLGGDRRREFVSRVATGDWDAIVMTHSTFELIPMSVEHTKDHIQEAIREIEWAVRATKADDRSNRIVKQLERMKKTWRIRLERLDNQARRDDFLHWEALGVDWIATDEAHLHKSLWRNTKMARVAGLPLANSQRAFDLYLKTRYTMTLYREPHRGVVLATATPVANSMAELHTFQRYLQPETLRAMGLEQFDAWAATFGEMVTALELAPDGSGYRLNTRFARFINVPDLMAIVCDMADIRTREMLNLPVPALKGDKPRTVTCRPSPELKLFVRGLVERAEKLRSSRVDPSTDNMLLITTAGRLAALDMRLVDDSLAQDPEGKVVRCAQEVHRIWREGMARRLTQLVFCDLSTPKGDGQFNVYEALRLELIGLGIPQAEISFMHEAETDVQKAKLFRKVREGAVRVLLGSTARMGVGTNVQNLLKAMHHLDCPWRPCDVEQRDGRILRQGNTCEEVEIIRYVTEGSFDAYSWQTVLTKAKFIAQVMSGDRGLRSIEDVELATLSYAEVKALASGNPLVIEKAGVDADVARYTTLFSVWRNQRYRNENEIASLPMRINAQERQADALAADQAFGWRALTGELQGVIDGLPAVGKDALSEALRAVVKRVRNSPPKRATEEHVGQVAGLPLWILADPNPEDSHLYLKGAATYDCCAYQTGPALYAEVLRVLQAIPDRGREAAQRLVALRAKLTALQEELLRPFEFGDRLEALLIRQRDLAHELELDKDEVGTQSVEANEQPMAA